MFLNIFEALSGDCKKEEPNQPAPDREVSTILNNGLEAASRLWLKSVSDLKLKLQ